MCVKFNLPDREYPAMPEHIRQFVFQIKLALDLEDNMKCPNFH